MRKFIAALGCLAAAALVAGAAPARAETAGPIRVRAFLQFSGPDTVARSVAAVTGVANGMGTMVDEGDDASGLHHDLIVLSDGTIDLASVENTDTTTFDPTTCTGKGSQTGTSTLSGTGRYAGLAGQGSWSQTVTLVARWSPHCTLDDVTTGYVVYSLNGRASLD